jgi:hypothetical protein
MASEQQDQYQLLNAFRRWHPNARFEGMSDTLCVTVEGVDLTGLQRFLLSGHVPATVTGGALIFAADDLDRVVDIYAPFDNRIPSR